MARKKSDSKEVKAFLLRGIPRELLFKMRAAAAIHQKPLKSYIRDLFETHIRDLEQKGLVLELSVEKEE